MEIATSKVTENLPLRTSSPKSPPSENANLVGKIIKSFNTWAFKREQPSDLALLTRFVTQAVTRQEPVSFVLYWGKGPRSEIANPDIECLDYLMSFAARIQDAYKPGAKIQLVLTDTHASLNGHSPLETKTYHGQIASQARSRGFECYSLGDLTAASRDAVSAVGFASPSEETLQQLSASAMKWYRGQGTAEEGAKKYYFMNMVERQVIELAFPSSIFISFNGREQRELFPENLPIFYMYSLRRGTSVKPWFLPAPEIAAPLA
jgi:L-tyrosine isonitrile synthase